MKSHIYVGAAAWNNPPAERDIRRPDHSHLQHYATRFQAVEINSSFYRRHQRKTYERWRELTPRDLRFSVKAPQAITHECALRHYHGELRQFLKDVGGLGRKLRVILIQTPPSLAFEPRVAARFFASLGAAAPCRIALEPRHLSWFSERAEALLTREGIARVAADPAKTPMAAEPLGARGLVYYRLHGSPRMYYSSYSADYLRQLSVKVKGLRTREIWCIFDNTAMHASWENALSLRKLLENHAW